VQSAGRPVIRLLRRLALSFAFCFAFAFAALAKEPRRLPNSDSRSGSGSDVCSRRGRSSEHTGEQQKGRMQVEETK
jgi:hypothetical protein